jgi:hypothetical protein
MRVMALAPDGKTLATGGEDGRIRLWDLSSGKELAVLVGHYGPVILLAISPDGTLLASGALNKRRGRADYSVRLWRMPSGKPLRLVDRYLGGPAALAFSADSKTLAVGAEKRLDFFDVSAGDKVKLLTAPPRSAGTLAFSADQRTLAVSEVVVDPRVSRPIRLFDLATGKLRGEDLGSLPLCRIAFSCDARFLAAAHRGGVVRLLDGRTAVEKARMDLLSGKTGLLRNQLRRLRAKAFCASCFSPDGQLLAACGVDSLVRVFEVATRQEVLVLPGHGDVVSQVVFAPDSKRLISRSEDQTILVWDLLAPPGTPRLLPNEPLPGQLLRLWQSLQKPGGEGYRSATLLTHWPQQTVPFLRARLKREPPRDARRVTRLVAQLDSDSRPQRDAAMRQLEQLGELAVPELEQAVTKPASAEVQRRAQALLDAVGREAMTGAPLRALRAVRVLEQIGTPAAREVLRELARGEPLASLTQASKTALQRPAAR